jgi:hypothetical protein
VSAVATQVSQKEAAREAGCQYGTMAADLCLVYISEATTEQAVQEHVVDLARNIREQAAQQAQEGFGKELAAIWKDAALKAAQARLEAFEEPGG